MTFEYTSNFEDYKAAQDLYLHHRNSARVRWLIWKFGLPGFTAVCAIVAFLGRSAADKGFLPMMIWFTACGFVLTILVVVMRPWNLRRTYRKLRRNAGLEQEHKISFSFDEEGVRSTIVGRSEGRFFWSAIEDYAEDEKIALLFVSKKQFLYIPKRAPGEESWNQLRAVIRSRVPGVSC